MKPAFEIDLLIDEMAVNLRRLLDAEEIREPAIVGIRTGGVWIAERLRTMLRIEEPLGELNIAFYRDDFSRIGIHPTVEPSSLPFDVDNRDLILVDDILYTGRTIRAAMNEIFDYGRPRSIRLAVLFDRSGRELPIQADIVGAHLSLKPREHAKLTGPSPLNLEIHRTKSS
jgi:pyrimidine operon attenuation protein/uracil phosphoribosyltransferase